MAHIGQKGLYTHPCSPSALYPVSSRKVDGNFYKGRDNDFYILSLFALYSVGALLVYLGVAYLPSYPDDMWGYGVGVDAV